MLLLLNEYRSRKSTCTLEFQSIPLVKGKQFQKLLPIYFLVALMKNIGAKKYPTDQSNQETKQKKTIIIILLPGLIIDCQGE